MAVEEVRQLAPDASVLKEVGMVAVVKALEAREELQSGTGGRLVHVQNGAQPFGVVAALWRSRGLRHGKRERVFACVSQRDCLSVK
jgi:hypothetical protein